MLWSYRRKAYNIGEMEELTGSFLVKLKLLCSIRILSVETSDCSPRSFAIHPEVAFGKVLL